MAQLIDYRTSFVFDGISSAIKNVFIITRDDYNEERIFGLNSSLETQDGIGDNKLFINRKNNTYSFEVEITKLINDYMPKSISEEEYDDIVRWLMTDEPKVFHVGGLIHYGCFTSATEFHTAKRCGIITLQFESIYPYAFSPLIVSRYVVSGTKTIKLQNKTNINNKNVYLDLTIKKTKNSGNVTIKNKRTNKYFTINNLALNEEIKVLGESAKEVISITNKNKNLFDDLDYNSFPYLVYGANEIEIIGDCEIQIEYQCPKALR